MTNTITYSKLKRTIEKRIGKNDVWGIRPFLRAHYQSKKPGQGKEWKLDREMVESIINEFIGPKKKNDWARKLTSDLTRPFIDELFS